MDIIGTINPWKCTDFQRIIQHVISQGIKCFRVNLKTYYQRSHFDYLLSVIKEMLLFDKDISFVFDIGYPRDTTRTIVNNENGYIDLKENNIFLSNRAPYYSNNTIFFKPKASVKLGDNIHYGDGQYYFNVIRCCAEGLWEARVSSSNIKIWRNTALHFQNEIYEEPQNMDVVIDFFDQIKERFDYKVALSFVETKEDLKSFIQLYGIENIICKIESQRAICNIAEISDNCSHIMLGRGDLLFNTKAKNFLRDQIEVIKYCKQKNKTITVSTGILVSMQNNILPSRAELVDFLLLNELGVDSVNLSSHVVQSRNIDRIVDLVNNCKK